MSWFVPSDFPFDIASQVGSKVESQSPMWGGGQQWRSLKLDCGQKTLVHLISVVK